MNKRQLIAAAARRSSLTQVQTREALEAILVVIAHSLVDGEHVIISGFGRSCKIARAASCTLRGCYISSRPMEKSEGAILEPPAEYPAARRSVVGKLRLDIVFSFPCLVDVPSPSLADHHQ